MLILLILKNMEFEIIEAGEDLPLGKLQLGLLQEPLPKKF